MKPRRNTSGTTTTSRTYSSAPPLHQKRFPRRSLVVHPSSTNISVNSTAQQCRIQQQTLTQIDFAQSFSSTNHAEDEDTPDGDGEWGSGRPRKKKRTGTRNGRRMTEEERAGQTTLTQIDFFKEEPGEEQAEDPGTVHCDGPEPAWYKSFLDREEEHEQREGGKSDATPNDHALFQNAHDDFHPGLFQSPACKPPDTHQPTPSDPHTPSKPIKAEIPSSQSPVITPLSRLGTPLSYYANRTPLQELHQNILAQRDEESPTKRRAAMQETCYSGGFDVNDLENLDSGWIQACSKASEHIEDPSEGCGDAGIVTNTPVKQEMASQIAHLSPSIFNRPVQKFTQNQFASEITHSSQATTVDLTQPSRSLHPASSNSRLSNPDGSPKHSGDHGSPPHPSCSSYQRSPPQISSQSRSKETKRNKRIGRRLDPRWQQYSLASIDSQLPIDDEDDSDAGAASPLASIHDGADLVTFSDVKSDDSDD